MKTWIWTAALAAAAVACVPVGGGGSSDGGGDRGPATDAVPAADGRAPADAMVDLGRGDGGRRDEGVADAGGLDGGPDQALPDQALPDQALPDLGVEVDAAPDQCGDSLCGGAEDCRTCPADCGACCGDGACRADHGEDCATCPADCACPEGRACDVMSRRCVGGEVGCGDGVCGADEDCQGCAEDCGCADTERCDADRRICVCVPACTGRVCGLDGCGGTCGDCPVGSACANGACIAQARCGDGLCDADEDCTTCPADCGCGPGERCDGALRACACAPQCDGLRCGDDGCGGVCGRCAVGEVCAEGACVVDCPADCGALWADACTADGFGYRVCAPDPLRAACTAPSRRVPCGEGRACEAEAGAGDDACVGPCLVPEVVVLVDRSSSMVAGGRWAFAAESLQQMAAAFGRRARVGVRAFPNEAMACEAGEIVPPAFDPGAALAAIPAPAQAAQTPILAAFEGLEPVFGDPNEAEAVVLITDGDETCADEAGVVARVTALRARGIRTFAVGISRQANGELLDRIAEAGGTATAAAPRYLLVEDGAELTAALAGVFSRLEVCPCAPGERRCGADRVEACAADGEGFVAAEPCGFGCDADTTACRPTCRPGGDVFACEGDTARACNAAGTAFDGAAMACEFGCGAPGGCFPTCRPGTTRCVDAQTVETCRADGTGWDAAACPDICVLSADVCGASGLCQPGDRRCAPAGLEVCDAQGAGFELGEACPGICQTQHGRCPVDLLGDAYERDGLLYVRGPDGWGAVTSLDDRGRTWSCFGLGYGSSGGAPERVANAHPDGTRYSLVCAGARWLGECQFSPSNSRDGVRLQCGSRRRGSGYCLTDAISFAYLGEGVFRPYACPRLCDPEPGVCQANPFETFGGQQRNVGVHQVAVVTGFGGGRNGLFNFTTDVPVEIALAAYGEDLNPVCTGSIVAQVFNGQGVEVFATDSGGCQSLFASLALAPGDYRLELRNNVTRQRYDLRVALSVQGPLGDALPP